MPTWERWLSGGWGLFQVSTLVGSGASFLKGGFGGASALDDVAANHTIRSLSREGVEVEISFALTRRWPFLQSKGHRLIWSSEEARDVIMSNPNAWKVFRRHEAMHILDAQKHPWLIWWSKPIQGRISKPGASLTRFVAEYRAYRIEGGSARVPAIRQVMSSIPFRVFVWDGVYAFFGYKAVSDTLEDGEGDP